MLKNISRKAKSLLHDGPLSNEVEMKYVSENRQRMMEIVQGQNHKINQGFPDSGELLRTLIPFTGRFHRRTCASGFAFETIGHAYYVISRIKYRTDS